MAESWTLTVSQLNEYVRVQLASDPILRQLSVQGEISGVKRAASGHIYFSLKDENARVQCVMFRQYALGLDFMPEDGMKVVVQGSASIYARDGAYQVYVESMQQQGLGDLYRRFMLLKERLAREGLFDPALKRELPEMPRCIGIATSRSGAVLHDILRVGWARWPGMRFVLAPCAVQGPQAAQEIAAAIALLDKSGCDVILCGRGGGSLEDLWPFNEEIVARAIRKSRTPVVSCVGHETDFTIADFAADARAATPSNAAEIVVPNMKEYLAEIEQAKRALAKAALGEIEKRRAQLAQINASFALKDPSSAWVAPRKNELKLLESRMEAAMQSKIRAAKTQKDILNARLKALCPDAPLKRGYALVMRGGRIADKAADMQTGDRVSVWMKDAGFAADVVCELEGSMWNDAQKKGTDV